MSNKETAQIYRNVVLSKFDNEQIVEDKRRVKGGMTHANPEMLQVILDEAAARGI